MSTHHTTASRPSPQQQPPQSPKWPRSFPVAFQHRVRTLLATGPLSPRDYFPYELAKMMRRDPDARTLLFDGAALWLAFRSNPTSYNRSHPKAAVFFVSETFCMEACELVMMLPVKQGQIIERRVLIDLIVEAANQCGYAWCREFKGKAGVFYGVVMAAIIGRYYGLGVGQDGDGVDELAGMMMGECGLGHGGAVEKQEEEEKKEDGEAEVDVVETLMGDMGMLALG